MRAEDSSSRTFVRRALAVLVAMVAVVGVPGVALGSEWPTPVAMDAPEALAADDALVLAQTGADEDSDLVTISSAQALVDFLDGDAPETAPKVELTADGTVRLLAPVTVSGDYGIRLELSEATTITLDLGGQGLTFANGTEERSQLVVSGAGGLDLVGEGTLTFDAPALSTSSLVALSGAEVDVACDVRVLCPAIEGTVPPSILLYSSTLTLEDGGEIREVASGADSTDVDQTGFIQVGYEDQPSALHLNGGTLAIAEGHMGVLAIDDSEITMDGAAFEHTSGAKLVPGIYLTDASSLTVTSGSIGPATYVMVLDEGTATLDGGTLQGCVISSGAGTSVSMGGAIVGSLDISSRYAGVADATNVSLLVQRGASAMVTGGSLAGDLLSNGAGSRIAISGGTVNGSLVESEGGRIAVTAAPTAGGAPEFTHPVPPSMLEGVGASMTLSSSVHGERVLYYPTVETARELAAQLFAADATVYDVNCATVTPDAVLAFAGYGSRSTVAGVLEDYGQFVGETLEPEFEGAQLCAYATVVPGQTYTFTFSDEDGTVLGTRTLTAGADDTGLLASLAVSAPSGGGGTSTPETGDGTPEMGAGVYSVSVELATSDTGASEMSFGVNAITLDYGGGTMNGEGSWTTLLAQGRWIAWNPTRPGYNLIGWTSEPDGYVAHLDEFGWLYSLPPFQSADVTFTALWGEDVVSVYRLWNPNDGAHLLTTDPHEVEVLSDAGWKDESVVFSVYGSAFPGSTPVTRLYNPNNGDHLYSTDANEVRSLVDIGWRDEGVKFYGSPERTHPVYRLWNSLQTGDGGVGSHLWTADGNEYDTLPLLPPVGAWKQEGTVWYAVDLPAA